MERVLQLVFVLMGPALLATGGGCGSAPPYAGEWVPDGSLLDRKGMLRPVAPGQPQWALRFDPPATVSKAKYDANTGTIDPASIETERYQGSARDENVVRFGMYAARVVDGRLMVRSPGLGSLRMSRPSRDRLFPGIRPVDTKQWAAEAKARAKDRTEDRDERDVPDRKTADGP